MIYIRVGQNIRRQRKIKKLTQKELAEMIHCSTPYLAGVEKGVRHIDLVMLDKIAIALDCDFMKLIERCDTHEAHK